MWRSLVTRLLWEQEIRRFKSSHPDMMTHFILWLGVGLLIISNVMSMLFVYKQYTSRKAEEISVEGCVENVKYLEKKVFELESEKIVLEKMNLKLSKSNKELKSRIDKINTKVRQISDHFKTN
jgi:ABC-type uncharacterized transport system permease subunit